MLLFRIHKPFTAGPLTIKASLCSKFKLLKLHDPHTNIVATFEAIGRGKGAGGIATQLFQVFYIAVPPLSYKTKSLVPHFEYTSSAYGGRHPHETSLPEPTRNFFLIHRHPTTAKRPSFADISTNLSLPDSELLKWSEADKSTQAGADKLGADLLLAQDLYKDLQVLYKN